MKRQPRDRGVLEKARWFTVGWVAHFCGVDPATARGWFWSGELRRHRFVTVLRVSRRELVRFVRERRLPGYELERNLAEPPPAVRDPRRTAPKSLPKPTLTDEQILAWARLHHE
jgi:hypothetical protein